MLPAIARSSVLITLISVHDLFIAHFSVQYVHGHLVAFKVSDWLKVT